MINGTSLLFVCSTSESRISLCIRNSRYGAPPGERRHDDGADFDLADDLFQTVFGSLTLSTNVCVVMESASILTSLAG